LFLDAQKMQNHDRQFVKLYYKEKKVFFTSSFSLMGIYSKNLGFCCSMQQILSVVNRDSLRLNVNDTS